MSYPRKSYLDFLIVTTLALLLYLPFRSIQWDLNGIIEAQAIDSGGEGLVSPNHLLYRPLGLAAFTLFRSAGYGGHSVVILQYITGIMAAIGIGLFWKWIKNLTGNVLVASLACVLLATAWSQWKFSTDVYYITPAAAMVAFVLVIMSSPSPLTSSAIIKLGVFVALAILFWQANIFLIPIVALYLLWIRRADSQKESWANVSLFMMIVIVIVGLTYLAAGTLVHHSSNIQDFTGWILSHSSEGTISLWGKWSADRFPSAAGSAIASFIPVWEGLGLRDLLRGNFNFAKLLAQLSLVAFVFLCLVTLIGIVRRRVALKLILPYLLLLGLAYCVYALFIVWWDPYEPKWFVIPNLFLVTMLALVWNISFNNRSRYVMIAGACIMIIAVANFTYTIKPLHLYSNPKIRLAQCFVNNAGEKDTILVTDWNWFDYADYFYDYKGDRVYLIGDVIDKSSKIQLIKDSLVKADDLGGHVYILDFGAYSQEELPFVEFLSGLTPADFDHFKQTEAFSCYGSRFIEIVDVK